MFWSARAEALFPPLLELSHPLAVRGRIRHIHDYLHQVIPVENAAVSPVTFHLLGFVAGRSEVIRYFQHRLGQPFRGNRTTIVKLKRKQYLESPPLAAHKLLSR